MDARLSSQSLVAGWEQPSKMFYCLIATTGMALCVLIERPSLHKRSIPVIPEAGATWHQVSRRSTNRPTCVCENPNIALLEVAADI